MLFSGAYIELFLCTVLLKIHNIGVSRVGVYLLAVLQSVSIDKSMLVACGRLSGAINGVP